MTVLLLNRARTRPPKPPEPIERSAEIDGCYRWSLTRRWGPGPLLPWCGCNPSDADGTIDDPTIWREMRFAWRWGYGGIIKFNRYPFRTPKLTELRAWLARRSRRDEVGEACWRNDRRILQHAIKNRTIMACWGNLVPADDIAEWLHVLSCEGPPIEWHCLTTTNSGAPTHPMARGKHRVPENRKPRRWRQAA